MALTYRGASLATPVRVKSSEARRNPDGTMEATVTWAVNTANLFDPDVLPVRGVTTHPDWEDFLADVWTSRTPIQGVTLFTVSYIAAVAVTLTPGAALPLDVEEENAAIATEEPITSAKNFLQTLDPEDIGGTPIDAITQPLDGAWPAVDDVAISVDPATGRFPLNTALDGYLTPGNKAIFDTFGQNKNPLANDYNPNVGKFLYFAPGSPLVGLESYLIARQEYSYSYASATKPDITQVGRFIAQPPGIETAPAGSYNYLLVAVRYRRSGAVYRVTETWRLSGPRGWSPLIYKEYVTTP
jgi:hypothetical protein